MGASRFYDSIGFKVYLGGFAFLIVFCKSMSFMICENEGSLGTNRLVLFVNLNDEQVSFEQPVLEIMI